MSFFATKRRRPRPSNSSGLLLHCVRVVFCSRSLVNFFFKKLLTDSENRCVLPLARNAAWCSRGMSKGEGLLGDPELADERRRAAQHFSQKVLGSHHGAGVGIEGECETQPKRFFTDHRQIRNSLMLGRIAVEGVAAIGIGQMVDQVVNAAGETEKASALREGSEMETLSREKERDISRVRHSTWL